MKPSSRRIRLAACLAAACAVASAGVNSQQPETATVTVLRPANVSDLMRACATEVKVTFARLAAARTSADRSRPDAEYLAKEEVIHAATKVAASDRRGIVVQRAAMSDEARTGKPNPYQSLLTCMYDRRLAQIDGSVLTGLPSATFRSWEPAAPEVKGAPAGGTWSITLACDNSQNSGYSFRTEIAQFVDGRFRHEYPNHIVAGFGMGFVSPGKLRLTGFVLYTSGVVRPVDMAAQQIDMAAVGSPYAGTGTFGSRQDCTLTAAQLKP